MVDHIGFAVRHLARTRAFHIAALAPPGLSMRYDANDTIAFGPPGKSALWSHGKGDGPSGVHIALKAETRARVDALYAAAIEAGGTDNGPPGLREYYAPGYYGAFVLDPDGHNLEAVCCAVEA